MRAESEFSVPLFLGSYANMDVYEKKNVEIQDNLIKICVGDFLKIKKNILNSFCSNLTKIRAF